jgi:hypothetical protein
MIPTELITILEAQADNLKAFSQYLQTCANIEDLHSMERLLKAYQEGLEGGDSPTEEVLPCILMKFATQLAAGDDFDKDKYSLASKIGFDLHLILGEAEPSELAFLAELLDAVRSGHSGLYGEPHSRVSARESVIAFAKNLDAAATPALKAHAKTRAKKAA